MVVEKPKFRFRTGFRGKLILQVQERLEYTDPQCFDTTYYNQWRDATVSDMTVDCLLMLDNLSKDH
jgi:hypothetical protein